MKRQRGVFCAVFLIGVLGWAVLGHAADSFYCEVLAIKGKAVAGAAGQPRKPIKVGDQLKEGDIVETGFGSYVDLAYDGAKKNVVRVEADCEAVVRPEVPQSVTLKKGGVFANLRALPARSTFEVETPTAIASVRGTEFRTTCDLNGATHVFNFSDSPVSVFGKDASGERLDNPVVLEESQKTDVLKLGDRPTDPQKMSETETKIGSVSRAGTKDALKEAESKEEKTEEAAGSGIVEEAPEGLMEDPQAVLLEMGKAYEAEDFSSFISRVSGDFSYLGELEEFTHRDFLDYDGVKLNFFLKRAEKTPTGATVRADWQMQYFPSATANQIEVRGENLDFVFVEENGKLKLKAMRGSNPLFGGRSPDIAAMSGVSSDIVNALQEVEDTGSRTSRQTALTLIGAADVAVDPETVPVNLEIISVKDTSENLLTSLPGTGNYRIRVRVRIVDNPKSVTLTGVVLQVRDSRTGQVLSGSGDLLPGVVKIVDTTDSISLSPGNTGTFTIVFDPDQQFTFIDRSQATTSASYSVS